MSLLDSDKLTQVAAWLERAGRTMPPRDRAKTSRLVDALHREVEDRACPQARGLTPATVANMHAACAGHGARQLWCYSPVTHERRSAHPEDYIAQSDDEPVCDANGEPMLLVRSRVHYHDAFTDRDVA